MTADEIALRNACLHPGTALKVVLIGTATFYAAVSLMDHHEAPEGRHPIDTPEIRLIANPAA